MAEPPHPPFSQGLRAAAPARPEGRGRLVIRAARVGGVEIPNAKRIETALTYVALSAVPLAAPFARTRMQHIFQHFFYLCAQVCVRHRPHDGSIHPHCDGARTSFAQRAPLIATVEIFVGVYCIRLRAHHSRSSHRLECVIRL